MTKLLFKRLLLGSNISKYRLFSFSYFNLGVLWESKPVPNTPFLSTTSTNCSFIFPHQVSRIIFIESGLPFIHDSVQTVFRIQIFTIFRK